MEILKKKKKKHIKKLNLNNNIWYNRSNESSKFAGSRKCYWLRKIISSLSDATPFWFLIRSDNIFDLIRLSISRFPLSFIFIFESWLTQEYRAHLPHD